MKKLLGLLLLTAAILSLTAFRRPTTSAPSVVDWPSEFIDVGMIAETISATGSIQPVNLIQVGTDSAGRVVRVYVEPGQVVSAGTALAQFDDRIAQLRLQQAKIAVELSYTEVQRAEAGRDAASLAVKRAKDAGTQLNLPRDAESADVQLRAAEATLKAAQLKVREAQATQQLAEQAVEMTIIRAPVSGIVLEKRILAGQQLGPPISAHVFTLAPDLAHLQITALVSESDIGRITSGMTAQFSVNAWPDQTIEGRVSRIGHVPIAIQAVIQYPVVIDSMNIKEPTGKEWRLRCGMSAAVDFVTRRHERVLKVPINALSVNFDETVISESAKRKLSRNRSNRAEWQRVWIVGKDRTPWPVFVRTEGRGEHGESGINDGRFVEVLAWDPDEAAPTGPIRVITAVPDTMKQARPGLKLF